MNFEHFKKRLIDKERELGADIARLEGEVRSTGESEVRDSADDASAAEAAAESLQEASFASQTLTEVRDALQRMKDGTYGQCTVCGRRIEPARLEAVPWAKYCLADQEKYDTAAHVAQGGSTL